MTVDPPRIDPEEPADPVPSDTDSDESDRNVFLSPGGSPQSRDSSENSDSSHADQDEDPEQESSDEDTPQASPQTRKQPEPKANAQPAKRPRSSPQARETPEPKAAKRPRSALKRIADHSPWIPVIMHSLARLPNKAPDRD